jgi:two-component system response regulator DctR
MSVASPSRTWSVLVVEDDPFVSALHSRLVDAMPDFQTVATASTGEEARKAVARANPDLAIVDLSMPGGDGVTFLRQIRREASPLEVIVVTAVRDAAVVREVMHLGIVDYLVKPFAPERLRQSLAAFLARVQTLRRAQLTQDEVDRVQSSGAARLHRLPKGLKRSTFIAVRDAIESSDTSLSADDVGELVGIARVTARRYLEYLEVTGIAQLERECNGPGRPRNRYRYRRQDTT